MPTSLWILISCFLLFLAMDIPVAFCIGLATTAALWFVEGDFPRLLLVAHKMANGIDSFSLLAIPFFVLSGLIMERGGIARRLIDAAQSIVGQIPGGLAIVNVLTCMLFGSISGSAAAAVSSIGGFMVPAMNKRGYNTDFTAALTTCAATTGLLIPPSNVMIIYSMATNGKVSIAAIFIAGVLPGILVGLMLIGAAVIISKRQGYGQSADVTGDSATQKLAVLPSLVAAIPALLLIIIVLGGILGGVFTATEASAIAVIYSLVLTLGVYRSLSWRDLPDLLTRSAQVTSVVLLLIACSTAMSYYLALERIPQMLSDWLLGVSDNKIVVFLLINIILLFVGTFMDMTPAVIIFTPIFLPVVQKLGMDPIQFGVVIIMNLCIGLCTPPVGTCLFLGCSIAETTMGRVVKHLWPLFLAMLAALLLTTYVPFFTMYLPRMVGLIK